MYNMSVTSFGLFAVIVLCIREVSAALTLTIYPSGNVNVGSTVVFTCTVNPAEPITWKRGTDSLTECDTISCVPLPQPSRYTFATQNGGQTVTMTLTHVHIDDNNKKFKCGTLTLSESHTLIVTSTTTASPDDSGLTTGQKGGIGGGISGAALISVTVIVGLLFYKGSLKHKLKQLKGLKDKLGEHASDENAPCELVCVIEVSSTANGGVKLSEKQIKTLASKLKPVVEPYIFKDVIVNKRDSREQKKPDYTTKLQCRSLTALHNVIDLIEEDKLNEILRDKEQKHQKLRTHVDADSIRDCVTYYSKEQWRREFKPVHELGQLNGLKKNFPVNSNDVNDQQELVCVIEASSTANGNEKLAKHAENSIELERVIKVLTSDLGSKLDAYLHTDVTVRERISNKPHYPVVLPCRSYTALMEVINLIRGDDWNKCLRDIEQNHKNTQFRTQVDVDSIRDCVKYYSTGPLKRMLMQLKGLKDKLGEHANDENAPCELVCVIEVSSTANGDVKLSEKQINALASKLKPVVEPYIFKDVIVNKRDSREQQKPDYKTKLQCRSLTTLHNVIDLIEEDKLNEILRDKEQKHQKLRTHVDADSIRDCVTYYSKEQWRREFKPVHELGQLNGLKKNFPVNSNDENDPQELERVIKSLTSDLRSKLDAYLHTDVTVRERIRNKPHYPVVLPCRSYTALMEVINLIRGDDWNKCLRDIEQNHKNTQFRTQVDVDSIRDCVKYYSTGMVHRVFKKYVPKVKPRHVTPHVVKLI